MTDVLDIGRLLAPVSASSASGDDLRRDTSPSSPYFRLRDARSEARALERQFDAGDGGASEASARWETVRTVALEALGLTRDVEIAVWLLESLVRRDGLPGLGSGARLLDGLLAGFWENGLHPRIDDEDGIEARIAPVAGLSGQSGDGTLLQPLRKLILFERPDGTPVSLWMFEQAEAVNAIAEQARRRQRIEAGTLVLEELEQEARSVGIQSVTRVRDETTNALEAWLSLSATLDRLAGPASPSTRRVADCLRGLIRIVARYVPEPAAETMPADTIDIIDPAAPGLAADRPVRVAESRAEMLQELRRIAEFFRRTEPNSPLSDTIDEAVRRSTLGWRELLSEIIPEADFRAQVLMRVGLPIVGPERGS